MLYTVVLAVLSLINISDNLIDMQSNKDKAYHGLAYAILTLLWFLTFFKTLKYQKVKAITLAALFAVGFGIILEVLQGQLTSYRSPDLKDVYANTFGVLLVTVLIVLLYRPEVKN